MSGFNHTKFRVSQTVNFSTQPILLAHLGIVSSVQERQRVDRKLFSELIETPINPVFLHVSTPLYMFYSIKTSPILNNYLTQIMENNARSGVRRVRPEMSFIFIFPAVVRIEKTCVVF